MSDEFVNRDHNSGVGGGSGSGGGGEAACNCKGFASKSVKRAMQLVRALDTTEAMERLKTMECSACGHSLATHRENTADEVTALKQHALKRYLR